MIDLSFYKDHENHVFYSSVPFHVSAFPLIEGNPPCLRMRIWTPAPTTQTKADTHVVHLNSHIVENTCDVKDFSTISW